MNTDNAVYDVAVIGSGVSGACIARELSRYQIAAVILESEIDVSFGTSKANSGIVHGGFHHNRKYLKSRLEIQGAALFDGLHDELGFPFRRCGILVAAMHPDEMPTVRHLYEQGVENGAPGIELCSRERMLALEPKLSAEVTGGLYAPAGGIVEPYRFVFSLIESALLNGAQLRTGFQVNAAAQDGDLWMLTAADGRTVRSRYVINAAGLYADAVSALFNAEKFTITARKGEYFLLDRLAAGRPQRVVFPVPSQVSKGMLVIPTVEGTTLIGPTADEVPDKSDFSTHGERLTTIVASARTLIPAVSERDVITAFAGLRPVLDNDFYIAPSALAPRLIQVAGIQSPGLTASPAIALMVCELLRAEGLELRPKTRFTARLKAPAAARHMSAAELDERVARDPAWGNIVCRCEQISEAEIVEAIRAGHTTLDGIKFYTRAQMGRCQGGFCAYKILKILMRETGLPVEAITKRGPASRMLEGEL